MAEHAALQIAGDHAFTRIHRAHLALRKAVHRRLDRLVDQQGGPQQLVFDELFEGAVRSRSGMGHGAP
jgi:hypothetical protein